MTQQRWLQHRPEALLWSATVALFGLPATVLAAPALQTAATSTSTSTCTLQLQAHRSGQPLLRLPLPNHEPVQLQLAFTHSVLGTPVLDSYTWRNGAWHLTEEQFEGEGYGLPHAAGAGESLQRHGSGWRLLLNRSVAPLVVRPLPAQQMQLRLPDCRQWLLGAISTQAIELTLLDCPGTPAP